MATDKAKELALDVDFETARAIHRVVRGMHDGECPKCHQLFDSREMHGVCGSLGSLVGEARDLTCPHCGFFISASDQAAAIAAFGPVMERNLAVFLDWRSKLGK